MNELTKLENQVFQSGEELKECKLNLKFLKSLNPFIVSVIPISEYDKAVADILVSMIME